MVALPNADSAAVSDVLDRAFASATLLLPMTDGGYSPQAWPKIHHHWGLIPSAAEIDLGSQTVEMGSWTVEIVEMASESLEMERLMLLALGKLRALKPWSGVLTGRLDLGKYRSYEPAESGASRLAPGIGDGWLMEKEPKGAGLDPSASTVLAAGLAEGLCRWSQL